MAFKPSKTLKILKNIDADIDANLSNADSILLGIDQFSFPSNCIEQYYMTMNKTKVCNGIYDSL